MHALAKRARGDRARDATPGRPGGPIDNTDSLFGWISTPHGALVASEAYGAPTWYPVNDSPADKAAYTFTVTVPKGKQVVANGLPVGRPKTHKGWTTYRYAETTPMASYLATVDIGDYAITRFTKGGLPYLTAVDQHLTGTAGPRLARRDREAAGDHRLLREAVRAVPVHRRPARSSTPSTPATRSRRRPGRSTRPRPTRPRSRTRPRTSGSATASPRSAGATSG